MAFDLDKEQAQQKAMQKQLHNNKPNKRKFQIPVTSSNERTKGYTYSLKPSVRAKMEKLAEQSGYIRGGRANVSAFLNDLINEMWNQNNQSN